jgi:hypothetical protein
MRTKSPPPAITPDPLPKALPRLLECDAWKCQNCGGRKHLETHHQEFRSHGGSDSKKISLLFVVFATKVHTTSPGAGNRRPTVCTSGIPFRLHCIYWLRCSLLDCLRGNSRASRNHSKRFPFLSCEHWFISEVLCIRERNSFWRRCSVLGNCILC